MAWCQQLLALCLPSSGWLAFNRLTHLASRRWSSLEWLDWALCLRPSVVRRSSFYLSSFKLAACDGLLAVEPHPPPTPSSLEWFVEGIAPEALSAASLEWLDLALCLRPSPARLLAQCGAFHLWVYLTGV